MTPRTIYEWQDRSQGCRMRLRRDRDGQMWLERGDMGAHYALVWSAVAKIPEAMAKRFDRHTPRPPNVKCSKCGHAPGSHAAAGPHMVAECSVTGCSCGAYAL